MRVLVVEDESIIAMHVGTMLSRMGHEVLGPTATGEDAVAMAQELHPDLVLMDIRLDNSSMDGIEAAAEIRRTQPIPVIYISAYADEATRVRAVETSGNAPIRLLAKPFDAALLRQTIESVSG